MPHPASALERDVFMRVLMLAFAKVGKTENTVVSLAESFGMGYVLNCGDQSALKPAQRFTKKFEWDLIRDERDMEEAIVNARKGCNKEKKYKWVCVDDFTLYAGWLEQELAAASANEKGEPDGRRYWREYRNRLKNIVLRLFECKAHVVFLSHYIEQTQEIEGQMAKAGKGIMPMLGGTARAEIPALFQDVLFMEFDGGNKENKRVVRVNPQGIWGPASRSIADTVDIPADSRTDRRAPFGKFWDRAMKDSRGAR